MTLVLHEHPDSPNCHKVRLLLSAVEQPYERCTVDLLGGETRTAAFLAKNPAGQIPVLQDGDQILAESNSILGYLADRFAPDRLGGDAMARAQVQRWMFWQACGATRPIAAIGYQRLIRPAMGQSCDERAVEAEQPGWRRCHAQLEAHLRQRTWLVEHWSVADIAVGVWIELADLAGLLEPDTAVHQWLQRLQGLPFWASTPGYQLLGGPWRS